MVSIGLIGCGRWGKNHARVLSSLKEILFSGISDTDPQKKALADELSVPFFENAEDLLDQSDALVVAVPTAFHSPVVRSCLLAKKHVLVEKPVTLASEETANLVALARGSSLILSVGYIFRFHPVVLRLKELVESLGEIHYITARYAGGQNRLWADSGAILNFGIHLIDILNFVLDDRPHRVYARRTNVLDPDREDSAVVVLAYDGFPVTLELSCVHPEKAREMTIVGSQGTVVADFDKGTLWHHEDGEGRLEEIEVGNPLQEQLKHFASCVSSANGSPATYVDNVGEEEPDTTRICELAISSAGLGKEVRIRD